MRAHKKTADLHLYANLLFSLFVIGGLLSLLWIVSGSLLVNLVSTVILLMLAPYFAHRLSPIVMGRLLDMTGADPKDYSTENEAWAVIEELVDGLTSLPEVTAEECGKILHCRVRIEGGRHFTMSRLPKPFQRAELRLADGGGLVMLDLKIQPSRVYFARQVQNMGQPEDLDVVSPPLNEAGEQAVVSWDKKFSLMYTINRRTVWFGMEEFHGTDSLVSIAVHF